MAEQQAAGQSAAEELLPTAEELAALEHIEKDEQQLPDEIVNSSLDMSKLKKEYWKYYRTDNPLADLRLEKYSALIKQIDPIKYIGTVANVTSLVIEGRGPEASIGEICKINVGGKEEVLAEVVGFSQSGIKLMAIGEMGGIAPGCQITATGQPLTIPVGDQLLGRVLDGIGRPIDNKGTINGIEYVPVTGLPPDPLQRERVTEPLSVGVRAVDSVLTVGKGQRLGIFSGSGVGKSTLLSMMARNTTADVNVIALIGERGKEVRDFIERDLGEEGLKKSVLIVATGEQEPLVRIRAAYVATAIAEYFRDKGKDVLLMMDSLTRFAQAQRQVGLSIGEPPSNRGFPPSVFSMIPKLVERAGTSNSGTITALYTVLVEGDDEINDPVADSARGHLDGHIVLSRDLAMRNHYPAIDVLGSISRAMVDLVDEEHIRQAGNVREVLKEYSDAEDLITIGAYARGSNPKIDYAIRMIDRINGFLKQGIFEEVTMEQAVDRLKHLFDDSDRRSGRGGRR